MNRNLLLFLLLSLAVSHYGSAQTSVSDSSKLLEEVTVTATRSAAPAETLPYAVSLLNRKEITRQWSRTLPEALTGLPGVFIQKTNHAGGSPFVRGLTGNQSLILVDGIRLNNSIFRFGPNQYMTLIDPAQIERVEVIKGTGSVQYGSDALTGLINLQTTALRFSNEREWQSATRFRLTESGMELSVRPEVKYEGKRFSFVTGGSFRNFGDLRGGDSTGFQRPSGYREASFDGKMMADLGGDWTLTAGFQWLQQDNVPVYHRYRLENFAVNTSDPINRGLAYSKLNKKFTRSLLKSIELVFSYQGISETRFSRKNNNNFLRRERDRISTVSAGADLLFRFNRFWTSNTGFEVYHDEVLSSRRDQDIVSNQVKNLRGLYPNGARYLNYSLYSLHHIDWRRWKWEGGLRYTGIKASLSDTTLGKVVLRPDAVVFQTGLSYRVSKAILAYMNISDGFRAPNIDDLGTLGIVDFRYEVPTADLKPERSVNYEAGIKFAAAGWKGYASVFRTRLSQLITRVKTGNVINGYDVYQKINVDRGFIRGWEALVAYRLHPRWQAQVSATSLYGQSITRNEPLRRIPPFNGRFALDYQHKRLSAGFTIDHAADQKRLAQGDKDDNRIPKGGTPGFTLINFYAAYNYRQITAHAYLNNLMNVDYRTHGSGINGMGRAFSIMLVIALPGTKGQ